MRGMKKQRRAEGADAGFLSRKDEASENAGLL
jgi:hypothetical protein